MSDFKQVAEGEVLRNKYGLPYRVIKVVDRGLVVVVGNDIHQSLKEWGELDAMRKHHGLDRASAARSANQGKE